MFQYKKAAVVTRNEWMYIIAYTAVTFAFLFMTIFDFLDYGVRIVQQNDNITAIWIAQHRDHDWTTLPLEPLIPWWIMFTVDWLWLILNAFARVGIPKAPLILMDLSLLHEEELGSLLVEQR